MIARKLFFLIVVAALGLVVGGSAVRELRGSDRTTVDPIEINVRDDVGKRDRPRKPPQRQVPSPPDVTRPPTSREDDPGADPAPAPPLPAGDDDGGDDGESESDDDDDDD